MSKQASLSDDFAYIKQEGSNDTPFVTIDPSQTVICTVCGATMKRMSPGPVGGLQNIKKQYTWSCRTSWCGDPDRSSGASRLVRYVNEDNEILDGNKESESSAKVVSAGSVEGHPEVKGAVLSVEAYESAKPDSEKDKDTDEE